jgi:hypothetical protein
MSRIACTLLLAAALPVLACSKATESAGAPAADLATPAGLTNTLTSKLGISEAQASQALGAILGQAKTKLSPSDYAKLSGAIPGADSYLSAAADAGISAATGAATDVAAATPSVGDSTAAPMPVADDSIAAGAPDVATPGADVADAAAAGGEAVGMSALNSAFSKIGLPPEAASQFVPVLTDYVGKVGGPEAANLLKGLF